MDRFWRPVTLLGMALSVLLACGCGAQEDADEIEFVFAEADPAATVEVERPGGLIGAMIDAPAGALAGELTALSLADALHIISTDPALRAALKGYRDRGDQVRQAVTTIWARYPGRVVGFFWGDAAQAARPISETVGLRTHLHVDTAGLGPVALPLRFQAPGLSPAPSAESGIILGVVVARSAPPTLGQVDAAIWAPTTSPERRLPMWSWGGLQRLSDDAVGLDLVLCDIGLAGGARAEIRWEGAAFDLDDPQAADPASAPLERDADARAPWKYSLQDGTLRAWHRGEPAWETPVEGTILAGLDGADLSLVVIGARTVEVVDAETGVLAARFVRGWEDIPGLADALALLSPERRDRDADASPPVAEIMAAAWEIEAQVAANRGWTPVASWWEGWATFFGSLPY